MRNSFLLAAFLIAVLATPFRGVADTVYTYTGTAYTTCFGTYASSGTTCAGPYALRLTFDLNTPLQVGDFTSAIVSFSFTDGAGLDLTQSNSAFDSFAVYAMANGLPTQWGMRVCQDLNCPTGGTEAGTANNTLTYEDFSSVGPSISFGDVQGNAGTWTVSSTAVPEPSSLVLLGSGVLGLMYLAPSNRRKHCR